VPEAEQRCEVARGGRHARRHRAQPAAVVPEPDRLAGAARADDQVLEVVAVDVEPRDPRAQLAERVGEEQLTRVIIEVGLGVAVAGKLRGDVLK
jgi:hypothetical protein